MRWPLVVVFLVAAVVPSFAQAPLPARTLAFSVVTVPAVEPSSFDLYDFRMEQRHLATSQRDVQPHSAFVIKKHLGAAAGWDDGNAHASIALYVTMAEWGRWNFGAPTVELGLGHYPFYDEKHKRSSAANDWTILISVASIHYRLGYLPSLGVNWYLNLEQIVDMHSNLTGSQFGVSFSRQ
jgi:hypothetical protein